MAKQSVTGFVLRKSICYLYFLLHTLIILLIPILFCFLLLLQLIVFHREKEGGSKLNHSQREAFGRIRGSYSSVGDMK